MQIALLNASYCRIMNEIDFIRDRQRNVECYEMGGKVGKKTAHKTHNANNLAKLNDAKCIVSCPFFA